MMFSSVVRRVRPLSTLELLVCLIMGGSMGGTMRAICGA
jgi:hypothetical protein